MNGIFICIEIHAKHTYTFHEVNVKLEHNVNTCRFKFHLCISKIYSEKKSGI